MIWLFVAIGIGILLSLAMLRFGLQRSTLALAGMMLAGLAALIWYAEFRDNSRSDFPVEAVQLRGFTIKDLGDGRHQLQARVYNTAVGQSLRGFAVRVLAKDCNVKGECVIIGDQVAQFNNEVPAGQARDIQHVFEFSNIRPVGKLDWGYQLQLLE